MKQILWLASDRIVFRRIVYPSSIDSISDLSAFTIYPRYGRAMPILVVMHGYAGKATTFVRSTLERLAAAYGSVFVIAPDMRGVGYSGGSFDSGGREIQDIIDAVEFVKANYAEYIDPDQIHFVGFSGGGGNAFSCAARFPDYFNTISAFFGISDYGYDPADGWYNNGADASQISLMDTFIGGTPGTVPDNYHSRASVLAITNFTGGYLWIFHDVEDSVVPVINSQNVADALSGAGLTNFNYSETDALDGPRWLHALPRAGNGPALAESIYVPPIIDKTYPDWTMPTSGNIKVAGYLDTKLFSLWLGNGKSEFASLVYDVTARTFTLTSDTGAYTYTLKLKGQTPGAGVTSTINGSDDTQTADGSGVVTYSGSA